MNETMKRVCRFLDKKDIYYQTGNVQFSDLGFTLEEEVIIADWYKEELRKLADVLDSSWGRNRNIVIGYEGEYAFCNFCGDAIYTAQPTKQNYINMEIGWICRDCARSTDYQKDLVREFINDPNRAMPDWFREWLEDQGCLELIRTDLVHGMHPGQNDSPGSILKGLLEWQPEWMFVFALDNINPFETYFSVYRYEEKD
jgi:hypothetical protein